MKTKTYTYCLLLLCLIFGTDGFAQYTTETTLLENKTQSALGTGATIYGLTIDYDNDGDKDFVVSNTTGSGWHLIRNNTSSFDEETTTIINLSPAVSGGSASANGAGFIVTDYDNDGDEDIIDPYAGSVNDAAILRNDGGGNFTTLTAGGTSPLSGMMNSTFASGTERYCFRIDYDNDNDEDFIVANLTGTGWHLIRNEAGVFTEETSTTIPLTPAVVGGSAASNATSFIVIDYDGDWDEDIIDPIAGNDTSATILRNDGANTFSILDASGTSPLSGLTSSLFSSGNERYSFPIDYDIDGDMDFIIANNTGSGWNLLRNNNNTYSEEPSTNIALTPAVVGGSSAARASSFSVTDYDNDGDFDIIDYLAGDINDANILSNTSAPPSVLSSIPADDETMFNADANISITFNESITLGAMGAVELRLVSDNSVIESIDVSNISLSGNTITLDPINDLIVDEDIYIHIQPGCVVDADSEIPVSLNNNPETLNFRAIANTLGTDNFTSSSFSIYPNPVKEVLYIVSRTTQSIDYEIKLYDQMGRLLLSEVTDEINFSNLSQGIYHLELTYANKKVSKKIIKS